MRAVLDTGVLVSALIQRKGTTGAVLSCLRDGRFSAIFSTSILTEIIDVLGRRPFRIKYHIEADDVTALINLLRLRGELVIPTRTITICRDPKDNKFIEAALAGKADWIVTGDADLLDLESFENIPMLRPAEFLTKL